MCAVLHISFSRMEGKLHFSRCIDVAKKKMYLGYCRPMTDKFHSPTYHIYCFCHHDTGTGKCANWFQWNLRETVGVPRARDTGLLLPLIFTFPPQNFDVDFQLAMKVRAPIDCACAHLLYINITRERDKYESNVNSDIRCAGGLTAQLLCIYILVCFLHFFYLNRFCAPLAHFNGGRGSHTQAQCTTIAIK